MAQPSNQPPGEVRNAAKPGGPEVVHPPMIPAVEPPGAKGDKSTTVGQGETKVQSTMPENALGHLNPSAPEDANVTPASTTVK